MRAKDKVWRALAALDLLRDLGHLLALVFLSDSRTALGGFLVVGSEVLFAKFFQLCGVFFKFKDSKDLDFQTQVLFFKAVIHGEPCQLWKTLIEPRSYCEMSEEKPDHYFNIQTVSTQPQSSRWKMQSTICRFYS